MKRTKLYRLLVLITAAILFLAACSSTNQSSSDSSDSSTLTSSEKKQLDKVTEDYRTYVEGQVDQLLTDTESWETTLKSGNLDEAKKQYPLIRMAYERSEPIAESFAELDVRIDYRLVDYTDENGNDEGWRGFHRIEKILWEENTTSGTEDYVAQLVKDIKELRTKVSTVEVTADMMTTGAVDLLNEVATSKITGEEEVFSHTDLYDFRANIEGAEKIFELFKPILKEKDSELVEELTAHFKTVNDLLDKQMVDDKNYKSYTQLTDDEKKELSEAVTELGEYLSQMGVVLE